ncbi:MAG: Trk system potassium transporter TrkA [Bacteroidaceae bacterium]|nr:Trk system potassium transporter TrkA [Bacteroidaceae bacterium]
MKIVIAGAGAVGSHLAALLSREDQDIILIDESPEKTARLLNSGDLDLMTLNVSPTSISGLREGGVHQCDLFIAVTPEETRNITCCMLAHTLGARKTIARVDTAEYTMPQYSDLFRQMGVDSIIYPEGLAAREILDGLKRSWVRQYWEVADSALVMLGIKLREKARITGIALRDLCDAQTPYHVVAIKRGDDTIIPSGNDELRNGDIVYFMTKKRHIGYIREIVGKEDYADVRNVMIMGGGRTSVHVAEGKPDFYNVKIIERSEERCHRLNELLEDSDIRIIQGDGRNTALLLEEGLSDMQAFCALTPETETNILACLAAKRMGVRKTVAMVENMDYVSMAEKLDIGTIINKKMIAASRIYQMMLDTDAQNVKCLTIANADVAEIVVGEGSIVAEKPVRELRLPHGITLGGYVRGDSQGDLINGNTQLQPGDRVVVFCMSGLIKMMDRYFSKKSSGFRLF